MDWKWFGPVSAAQCRAIARSTFGHFGRLLVLLLKFSTLTPQQVRDRVDFEGDERVRDALAAGKGAIVFSGHFGYWELQGLAHALVLPPMSVLARPLDNPYLHALLESTRCATGNRVIYRQGALRRVLRALGANECVAILIDQHIQGSDAVRVDFFNRPVSTTSALATLALRRAEPALTIGEHESLCADEALYVFARPHRGKRFAVLLDFGPEPRTVHLSHLGIEGRVALSTHLDRRHERVSGQCALRGELAKR